MLSIRAAVFDLDNVLYDEKDYVFPALRKIARFIAGYCRFSEDAIYFMLISDFNKKGSMYPRLFNDILDDLRLDQSLIKEILRLYAQADPKLEFFPETKNVLLTLRDLGIKLALVTNGGVQIQRNKIRLLDAEKYFDAVLYAREIERGNDKPDPQVYWAALQKLGVEGGETICVGDNPFTDFYGAKQLGMRTIRVLYGEFKDVHLSEEYEADFSVNNIAELISFVQKIHH